MPRLSVSVISFNGAGLLTACLEALVPQARGDDIEILVVVASERRSDLRPLEDRFPAVLWVEAPAGATVPQMRSIGITRSRSPIVALVEDDCVAAPNWCRTALVAHQSADVAIGGVVEPGNYRRALDWAVYFCEYSRFLAPLRAQANIALALAGNNVTYKRARLLELMTPDSRAGFYDMFIHLAWQRAGVPMRVEETLVVRNVNSWRLEHVSSVPYHHGRAFAAQRVLGQPGQQRLMMGLLAVILPLLRTGRIVRETVSRRRFVARLFQALPWITLFNTSWSIGEVLGYWLGPGRSASKWR